MLNRINDNVTAKAYVLLEHLYVVLIVGDLYQLITMYVVKYENEMMLIDVSFLQYLIQKFVNRIYLHMLTNSMKYEKPDVKRQQ
jgi:hypothetical protein